MGKERNISKIRRSWDGIVRVRLLRLSVTQLIPKLRVRLRNNKFQLN